jgi:Protein of unknown function (DUF1275)
VDQRDGPLPALLLALTVMVGALDATTIVVAQVFASAMTGNVVFLGLPIMGAREFCVTTICLPLGGFVLGVLVGRRACRLGPITATTGLSQRDGGEDRPRYGSDRGRDR